jgi:hypothetical protein
MGIGHGVSLKAEGADEMTMNKQRQLRQWPDQHSNPIPGRYKIARSDGFGSLASQGRAAGK